MRWMVLAALACGCATTPRHPLDPHPRTVAQRRMQTRRFETTDEILILQASSALLVDHGFTIDTSEDRLGVLVASKDRKAIEAGQVILSIIAGALSKSDVPYDHHQKMRASIVTRRVGKKSLAVRATFQRIVWNNHGQISKREPLNDPEIYTEFFAKLAKALFLEAHEL
ncbi:MAG: hypothetical protein ACYS0K_17810 [Planctomycetota bacterium]|jgi:hypothetical protein